MTIRVYFKRVTGHLGLYEATGYSYAQAIRAVRDKLGPEYRNKPILAVVK